MVVVHRIFTELCSFPRWIINIPGTEGFRALPVSDLWGATQHLPSFVENKLYSIFYIYILRSFYAYAFEYF